MHNPSRYLVVVSTLLITSLLHPLPALSAEGGEAPKAAGKVRTPAPTPEWIWQNRNPGAEQKVFFRREFQLPQDVVSASVTVTCDNWQRIWVNGKDFGFTNEWAAPANHDLTSTIVAGGPNVIAVEGRNQGGIAGLALRFTATIKGGATFHLVSDGSWLTSLESAQG